MRESTSPPRTPTPRSDFLNPSSPSGRSSSPETVVDQRLHLRSSISPSMEQSSSSLSSSPQQLFSIDGGGGGLTSQLDLDFPKLTPPKSKSPRSNISNNSSNNINRDSDRSPSSANEHNKNMLFNNSGSTDPMTTTTTTTMTTTTQIPNNNNLNNNSSHHHHNNNNNNMSSSIIINNEQSLSVQTATSQTTQTSGSTSSISPQNSYDKENRCPRENCHSNTFPNEDQINCESPTDGSMRINGKKHRNGPGAKGTKPRLKTMGSSSSVEGCGNNSSGFISRGESFFCFFLFDFFFIF